MKFATNFVIFLLPAAVLFAFDANQKANAQATCGEGMGWNTCTVGLNNLDFVLGSEPADWPVTAIIDPNDPRCADVEAVGAMWTGRGVGRGVDVVCDDEIQIGAAAGWIVWLEFEEEPPYGPCIGCPDGVPTCTCMQYFCPSIPTVAVITKTVTMIDEIDLVLGAPPVNYSSTWDTDRVHRALISSQIGAMFNLADADEPLPHQPRTMTHGTRGHWSTGDAAMRVHPLPPENHCLHLIYGADSSTEDDIDFTIANATFDSDFNPYVMGWSKWVRNDTDGTRFVCPGDPISYEYMSYNRTRTSIFALPISTPYEVAIYASTDQTLDTGSDLLIKTDVLYYVVSQVNWKQDTLTLPLGVLSSQNYYFFAVVDPEDDFDETIENNNVIQLPGYVQTKSSCP